MNEFKKLNDRFDRVENKIDWQTIQIEFVIQDAQLTKYLTPLETTNGVYDDYVENNFTFHKNRLKDRYHDTNENVRGLEAIIGQYFQSFMNTYGNFGVLFNIYTNIVAKLTKLKLAFGVGCFENCKNEDEHSESECTSICFEHDQMYVHTTALKQEGKILSCFSVMTESQIS